LSGDEDEEAESASAVEGFESLLDQMIGLIENPWSLDWHYRSLDESLIAFSNRHIYGDRLITFPGAGGPPALSRSFPIKTAKKRARARKSEELSNWC
jgi:hypothetical protein